MAFRISHLQQLRMLGADWYAVKLLGILLLTWLVEREIWDFVC